MSLLVGGVAGWLNLSVGDESLILVDRLLVVQAVFVGEDRGEHGGVPGVGHSVLVWRRRRREAQGEKRLNNRVIFSKHALRENES